MCGEVKHPKGLPLQQKICSISRFGYLLHCVGSYILTILDICTSVVGCGRMKTDEKAAAIFSSLDFLNTL